MDRIGFLPFGARTIGILCRVSIVAAVCFVPLSAALAEVHVSGSKDAVTVQAKDASFGDVIATINATLHVKINVVPMAAIPVTGTYSGPLWRVVARMLAGHDFMLASAGDSMTIILTTQAGRDAVHRPAAARANVAVDGEPSPSGVQGWVGGFSPKLPGQAK